MQQSVFKKLVQVSIVVNDLDATVKRYCEDIGLGPWKFYTIEPGSSPAMTLRGQPVEHAFRLAIAMLGEVEWELIQPLDHHSVYAEHLATHGEGLHHVAMAVDNYQSTLDRLKARGYQEIQTGRAFDVAQYSYLNTDQGLGCIVELGALDKDKHFPPPDFIYP